MICSTCKADQPCDNFPKNEKRCRPCLAVKYKRWALKNADKRRAINLRYSRTDKGLENSRRCGKSYRERGEFRSDPEWRKLTANAQGKLKYAVKTGKIKRQPCNKCGDLKTHGHHHDYSKPLDVIWLCSMHHKEIHHQPKE